MTKNSISLAGIFCDEYLKPIFEKYGRDMLTQLATRPALITELEAFGKKFADEHGIKAGFFYGETGNTEFPYDLIIYDKEKCRKEDENAFIWTTIEEAEKHMIAGIGIFTQAEDRLSRFMGAKAREKQHKNPKLKFAAFHLDPKFPMDPDFGGRSVVTECKYFPLAFSVRKYIVYPNAGRITHIDPDVMKRFFEWVFSEYIGGKEKETKETKEVKEAREAKEVKEKEVKEAKEVKKAMEVKEVKNETEQKKAS